MPENCGSFSEDTIDASDRMIFIQFEEFVTAQGYACILSSATLNMRWASLTSFCRACYGPSPLLCPFEQFLLQHSLKMLFSVASETRWERDNDWSENVDWGNQHLRRRSPANKRFKRTRQMARLRSSGWLVMTLISPRFFPVDRIMTSSFRANLFLLLRGERRASDAQPMNMREKDP